VAETFPRTTDLPAQSPNFWVAHKDRYLRQLLVRDIQAITNRRLVVYFGDDVSDQCQIDSGDDVHMSELLNACGADPVDLMLETIGGQTDATEKLCSLLRANKRDLRVIVPRRAKSNGTVIALAGTEIVMGVESELGPIDPSMSGVPVDFILRAPQGSLGPIQVLAAHSFQQQTKKLATPFLPREC
jgi:ClpP class serine protease